MTGSVQRDTVRLVAFSGAVSRSALGIAVIVAFNTYYWLPIPGETPARDSAPR